MKFVELEKEEYRTFADTHPLKSFFQTTEMEELGKESGWTSYYVGVKKGKTVIAASRLMSYRNRLGYQYFYAPRGLLVDYRNFEVLKFFTEQLKKYLRSKKGYVLRIDPTVVHLERDSDGKVMDGVNNEWCTEYLKKLGYHHLGYQKGYNETSQCRWVYCLNLEGKNEDDILREMRPTARNQIKKTSMNGGVRVRELSYDELSLFKKITEEASERKNFHDKPLSYYQHMYQLFHPKKQVQFVIAELYPQEYFEKLNHELQHWEESLMKLSDHPRNQGKKKELQVSIDSTKKKLKRVEELCKKGKIIPIAASMFMLYGDEVLYYHSGNYKEYIEFNGQRMIQWYMIKYALKNGFKRYNFYGIDGNFEEGSPDGVYEFKKGFGGYVEEYIGDFDLPLSWYYYVKKMIKRD